MERTPQGAASPTEGSWTPGEAPASAAVDWPTPDRGWRRTGQAAGVVPEPLGAPSLEHTGLPEGVPGQPSFSPDGRFWWDGTRWQQVPDLDAPHFAGARRGGSHGRLVLVAAAGLAVVLALVAAATLPGLLDRRASGTDHLLEEALLHAVAAQEAVLAEQGGYAVDGSALSPALAASTTADVAAVQVTVHRVAGLTYCMSAHLPGQRGMLWVTELGHVSHSPCD